MIALIQALIKIIEHLVNFNPASSKHSKEQRLYNSYKKLHAFLLTKPYK